MESGLLHPDFVAFLNLLEREGAAWCLPRTPEEPLAGLEEERRVAYGYTEAPPRTFAISCRV